MSSSKPGMLAQAELERLVADGEIDTVIVAFCDMQGRLTGKRVSARLFVEDVAAHGAECCNYLLAVDVDMNTVDGYAISSWETGYGDMVMTPDFDTLRLLPWLPGTALVMADLSWTDHTPVVQAPRSILNRQIDRLAERGLVPYIGTELEFMVFDDTYREAWSKGYRGLTASTDYNVDYAMLASTRMEPLLRDIRLGMEGAGLYCEGVKGECNLGQQEIAFRYDHARVTCDNHTIYKNGAKEIADQHGKALTFMAKFDEREGNSCHIHISFRGDDGSAVFADDADPLGMSPMFRSFIAGQLATLRELTLFYAPNINSYKRFVDGSFAPTAVAWGMDVCVAGGRPWPRYADGMPRARRRRQPVPRGVGTDRGRAARYRAGTGIARGAGGQRLHQRGRTAAHDADRGRGTVRELRGGAPGVR
jgi:glutamine synthetase